MTISIRENTVWSHNVVIARIDDDMLILIDEHGYAEEPISFGHRAEIPNLVEKYLSRRLTHPAHPRYINPALRNLK